MKFLHLGDLHIGKIVNDFNMIDDQRYILDQILDIAGIEKVDAILVAGDVYDKTIPTEEGVGLLDYFINQLVFKKIKTYIISGNHDSDERLNFGRKLFENSNVYISSKYDGKLVKHSLQDEFGKLNIYMLPFVKASLVKHFFPDEIIDSYDKAIRTLLKEACFDESERNIILAHQFVAGKSSDPDMAGSENIQSVGTVERVGVDCFDSFDYVALGHIHSPQKIERENVRYAGSPLKYSLSELNNNKSVPIITMKEKGNLDVKLVELKPKRDMRHLKGRLEQLMLKENVIYPEDYIYVTLTDEIPELNAANIIRERYKNLIKLDFENSSASGAGEIDIMPISKVKSFKEIISDFYKLRLGAEISEEELEIMEEIAMEAGVNQ